jgi:hypothetical protein
MPYPAKLETFQTYHSGRVSDIWREETFPKASGSLIISTPFGYY